MSELGELRELILKHTKDSADDRVLIKESIARIETHQLYTKEKIQVVDKLEKIQNQQRGFIYALSLIGLGGIYEFFRHLLR